jgi:23S rRNA (adenine1618-N6)-methyltransferase
VASDIDPLSIKSANQIIAADCKLKNNINCRLQQNSQAIFEGIIKVNEFYHLTMCNPPFHKSLLQAEQGSVKKWKNLNSDQFTQTKKVNLNFGGQKAELFCQGGELKFIQSMIKESKVYKQQVLWFTCLVSKGEHLKKLKFNLKKSGATHVKVVKMNQGQKISRFIAWSFHKAQ